jgi:hypothetical protein
MVPERGLHSCVKAKASPTAPVGNVTNSVSNVSNKTEGQARTAPRTNAAERYLKRLEADRKRLARWRAANSDRYRAYQRDLMRKKRCEEALASAKAG